MLLRKFNITTNFFCGICIILFLIIQTNPGIERFFVMDPYYIKTRPWMLLTCNFTHIELNHIFDNLFKIFTCGMFMAFFTEKSEKISIFIIIFSCIASGFAQFFLVPGISLGASGVGGGLMIFTVFELTSAIWKHRLNLPVLLLLIPVYVIYLLDTAVNVMPEPTKAYFPHIAGMIVGTFAFVFDHKIREFKVGNFG